MTVPFRPMDGGFEVGVEEDGTTTVIRVAGELDLATSPALREACDTAIERKSETVRLDLSGVSFLDSTGISVLVQTHKQLDAQGGALVLYGLRDQIRRVLDVAGLGAFFRVADERPS